jgi:hypothetical protein
MDYGRLDCSTECSKFFNSHGSAKTKKGLALRRRPEWNIFPVRLKAHKCQNRLDLTYTTRSHIIRVGLGALPRTKVADRRKSFKPVFVLDRQMDTGLLGQGVNAPPTYKFCRHIVKNLLFFNKRNDSFDRLRNQELGNVPY